MPILWYAVRVSKQQFQKMTGQSMATAKSRRKRTTAQRSYRSHTVARSRLRRRPYRSHTVSAARMKRRTGRKSSGVVSHKIGIGMNHGIMPIF